MGKELTLCSNLEGFIEAKFVRRSTRKDEEKQRFFNDFVRTVNLDATTDRLFNLCGASTDYSFNFIYLYESKDERKIADVSKRKKNKS